MKISILNEASKDFINICDYYSEQNANLYPKLVNDFEKTLKKIHTYPKAWQQLSEPFRRCLFSHFPLAFIYTFITEDEILIIAVMHLKQDPAFFKDRLS